MQNAFSIGTASGIPMDEITRTTLLRTSILGYHVMDKLVEGYDHDYLDFLQQTFNGLCDYLNMHLSNAESREADTKAQGQSVQHKGKYEDDILLSVNAEQITAYLAATNDAKKGKSKLLLQHPVQMVIRSNPQKDYASSITVTVMEPNTRTPQQSAKSCKQIENDSHRLCATQLIANLLREAATENLEHHQ